MPVVSAENPHSSATGAVAPGREYCGQDAEAVPAAPAAAAHQRTSLAPPEPPNVMVFHVGEASVLLLNWLLMVVKSAMSHLLSYYPERTCIAQFASMRACAVAQRDDAIFDLKRDALDFLQCIDNEFYYFIAVLTVCLKACYSREQEFVFVVVHVPDAFSDFLLLLQFAATQRQHDTQGAHECQEEAKDSENLRPVGHVISSSALMRRSVASSRTSNSRCLVT